MDQLLNEDLTSLIKKVSFLSRKTDLSSDIKNLILAEIVQEIHKRKQEIIRISAEDYALAKAEKLEDALLSRLKFDADKIQNSISGLEKLMELDDPVGQIEFVRELDDHLILTKKSYPVGVIGVIFEARPDAFLQMIGIAIKTNNFMILKPGKEAQRTCSYLMAMVHNVLLKNKVPLEMLTLLHSRSQIDFLLKQDQYIDLIIPRGSKQLVEYIKQNTNIPVLGHADGVCHIYVDQITNVQQTLNVIIDSKIQYAAACNAVETILVNQDIAAQFLPVLISALEQHDIEIYADEKISELLTRNFSYPESWSFEYSNHCISLKMVHDLREAIDHINTYGSHHTDAIITDNPQYASTFMQQVDSANVYHNCSTRFADGYRYGFGAEVGISTYKILPRGPVAIEGLTTYKYHIVGNLHIVGDYAKGVRRFKHSI